MIFHSCKDGNIENSNTLHEVTDSISSWFKIAKDDNVEEKIRLNYLLRIKNELINNIDDSLTKNRFFLLTDIYYNLDQDSLFYSNNEESLIIALQEEDTALIGEYNWNKAIYFYDREKLDSSFYYYQKAHKYYSLINHEYYKSKMEFNMSFIHYKIGNYVESQKLIVSAIQGFKKLNRNRNLVKSYNRLLLLDKEFGDYSNALKNYNTAISYLKKIDNKGFYKETLLNNLSLVYRNQNKFAEAIRYLDEGISNVDFKSRYPRKYITLFDNRTYSQFLMDPNIKLVKDFNDVLEFRDSIGDKEGIIASKTHLTEYYLKYNDTARAHQNAVDAYDLSVELDLPGALMGSLNLLSRTDPANASEYMQKYIQLNDSLLLAERRVRDKFSRIRFETEEYIEENIQLKEKNVWISVSSALSLVSIGLLFFVYRQKSKNRHLFLEKNQKEQNEEIYDLMLKQQNREERGRVEERMRISEELHDGVLARLFSVRMGLGFFNIRGKLKDGEKFDKLTKELQVVEKEIRNLSHALKNDELTAQKDFPNLLENLMKDQSGVGFFSYRLKIDEGLAWNQVSDQIKINLYRTVQESIYNIIKHAQCNRVDITIERKDAKIELKIVDNGIGFDTNRKKKGIGLNNIKSRAKNIGGRISIESEKKNGTAIKLTIPTKTFYNETVSKSSDS
ncbi:tetratricopeptide repeat-containing sensor histidine kinase [Lutimonas zeaxanthinifaciens]|uniref:tetratricopeptide repeat-containing sensor histidine kinase n=1 Tax=Lutimonas zeaxanthinifaciens TaxID=3060215 RepID=UPI00265D324B|nr:ATP-binding protein [Lutimonas sp. YSD2104]WKK67336.1 ATP-binding protein [Lutimonas sp. YSD2104]